MIPARSRAFRARSALRLSAVLLACMGLTCSGGGAPDGGPCTSPSWRSVFAQPLDRSVLSVWGTGDSDVWLAGGGLGVAGRGALLTRWDGARWQEIATGRSETLWWVFGTPAHTPAQPDIWAVGENGLVLRYNGQQVTVVPSSTTATLYGVWGASANDLWLVGGTPGAGRVEANDVLLRWNGATLTRDTTLMRKGATLFKVWGSAQNNVYVSGETGTLWRHDGNTWTELASALSAANMGLPVSSNVLTVHGCSASEVYAVAGASVFAFDGASWRVARSAPSGANGVSCGASGVLVVGNAGTKLRYDRASTTWIDHRRDDPWQTDFHGAWVSPSGTAYAGGGNFLTPASVGTRTGIVGKFGCR